jgi:hypothetical protein
MWLDFIAMFGIGAGVGAAFYAARHLTKGKLPKWSLPVAIGAAMLIFSIWNEYSWFTRVTSVLPPEVVVLDGPPERVLYRPWTYVFPVRGAFTALDTTVMQIAVDNPSLRRAELMEVRRWTSTVRFPVSFDCAAKRRVVQNGDLLLPQENVDDQLQRAACAAG